VREQIIGCQGLKNRRDEREVGVAIKGHLRGPYGGGPVCILNVQCQYPSYDIVLSSRCKISCITIERNSVKLHYTDLLCIIFTTEYESMIHFIK
jgi:hypothetical protein